MNELNNNKTDIKQDNTNNNLDNINLNKNNTNVDISSDVKDLDNNIINNKDNTNKKKTRGGFQKGVSGNPSGRPKTPDEVKELFKASTMPAAKFLLGLINNPKASNKDRLKAAELIFDRTLGKAVQPIDQDLNAQVLFTLNDDLKDFAK